MLQNKTLFSDDKLGEKTDKEWSKPDVGNMEVLA
jgi:hypothetical protein